MPAAAPARAKAAAKPAPKKAAAKPAGKKAAAKPAPKKAATKPAAKKAAAKPAAEKAPAAKATPAKPAPKAAAKRKADDDAAPAAKKAAKAKPKVDHLFAGGGEVYQEDGVNYAVTLNQTNIGANNNKFYIIQVIQQGTKYVGFTRWGRVGEPGQQAAQTFPSAEGAKALFKQKFKDKTKNAFEKVMNDHSAFVSAPGKYDLVETAIEEETPTPAAAPAAGKAVKEKPCTLCKELQEMLTTVFDKDMFKKEMVRMGMDPSKIPLGKLTAAQVKRGYEALEAIETAVKAGKKKELDALCSTFYTHIPHNFGRSVPPLISDDSTIQAKYELLNVLADIEVAQQTEKAAGSKSDVHPMDAQYKELGTGITYVDPKSAEFKWIETYTKETACSYRKPTIKHAFRVDRPEDKKRMDKFKKMDNRRMLWHGTNVAVVAAILKTGLRIMPHAGGRVGQGLYFASENGKSAGYTRTDQNNHGFMFLNEVVLGKPKEINTDDWTLNKKKVEGYKVDSIIARGRTEPEPKKDITIDGEWGKITVPQGKPMAQKEWNDSSFSQTEYLVYDEGQVRIKYILMMKF